MSNKFTGITSAGSAIPVYDKDAHQALSSKLDTTAFSSVSGEFATVDDVVAAVSGKADTSAIPSLDGYATQEWVGEQGYLTEVPAGYATTEDVISATSGLQPSGDYASATDLANYQPVSSMSAYQPVGDYYSASNPSGFISAVPDTYLQNTDLTIVNSKITEISGVPLSAGDELPASVSAATDYVTATSANIDSTITNVSANSGAWGGSALPISAGPGIKFEMVNNTLVASTDETVLFSGDLTGNGATAQLSEPITNFERIKVFGHTDDGTQCPWCTEFYSTGNTMDVGAASNNAGWGKWFNFTITTGGLYTNVTGRVITFGSTTWGSLSNWGTTRVIGINRLAGGN